MERIKNKNLIIIITTLIIFTTIMAITIPMLITSLQNRLKMERQKEIEDKINFDENIQVEVYSDVSVSDVILNSEIQLLTNYKINTTSLGKQKIKFDYKYEDYKFTKELYVEVVDTTRPTIFANSSYTVTRGSTRNFITYILSGDNYDDNPERKIIGTYDLNKVGTYPVTYYIKDSSGNENEADFTIKVVEPSKGSSSSSSSSSSKGKLKFSDIISEYKTDKTEIGIDVSKWQGNIDFEKVKKAGCEFVLIRLGHQTGIDSELIIDPYFEKNIKSAKEQGLKVGVYLYTYAKNKEDATNQAKWVYNHIKDYDLELGVSYDWESWTSFNKLNLSYYNFTEVAETFMSYLEKKGYNTMLYSSKYYLENIWINKNYDVWLAHYTKNTNYAGKYNIWQRTNSGNIDGINGAVDVDILYK